MLRPLRPWLYPAYRRWLSAYRRWLIATGRAVPTVDEALARAKLKRSPIRPLRRDEFQAMADANPYYQRRWGYTSHALLEAVRLIVRDRLTTALELGAPVRPVIVGARVMDYRKRDELEAGIPATIHDATVVPWPFADKSFDLFVALQVFEHLGDRQREAFLEVRRIARHAILSLPIDWIMDDPTDLHHMISEERALSWFAPLTPSRTIEHLTGRRKRLIFVFEDLPLP